MTNENNFWYKDNWTNPDITYLKNNIITEFDLTAAASNIMLETGIINEEKYNEMMTTDKMSREVMVGKIQKGKSDIIERLTAGYREARRIFVENNNITENMVLAVRRDALYIIGEVQLNGYVTDHLIFRPKNRYTAFLRYTKEKEMYLSEDKDKDLVVKGFRKEVVKKHKNGFFKFVKELLILDQLPNQDNSIFRKLATLKYQLSTRTVQDKVFYCSIFDGFYNYGSLNSVYQVEYYVGGMDEDLVLTENFDFILFLIRSLLR